MARRKSFKKEIAFSLAGLVAGLAIGTGFTLERISNPRSHYSRLSENHFFTWSKATFFGMDEVYLIVPDGLQTSILQRAHLVIDHYSLFKEPTRTFIVDWDGNGTVDSYAFVDKYDKTIEEFNCFGIGTVNKTLMAKFQDEYTAARKKVYKEYPLLKDYITLKSYGGGD